MSGSRQLQGFELCGRQTGDHPAYQDQYETCAAEEQAEENKEAFGRHDSDGSCLERIDTRWPVERYVVAMERRVPQTGVRRGAR